MAFDHNYCKPLRIVVSRRGTSVPDRCRDIQLNSNKVAINKISSGTPCEITQSQGLRGAQQNEMARVPRHSGNCTSAEDGNGRVPTGHEQGANPRCVLPKVT